MAYSKTCPDCGAYLDPGEKCDCKKEEEQKNASPQKSRKGEKHIQKYFNTIIA